MDASPSIPLASLVITGQHDGSLSALWMHEGKYHTLDGAQWLEVAKLCFANAAARLCDGASSMADIAWLAAEVAE